MAFTVLPAPSGKHRRPRRAALRTGTTLAGVAVLTAAGTFGATAATALSTPERAVVPNTIEDTSFARALDASEGLTNSLAAQAAAQHKAADETKRKAAEAKRKADEAKRVAQAAEAAKKKAAAEAKIKAERAAEARAARAAEERRKLNSFVLPVNSGIGTGYKVPGSMWSSGYHTGVDFTASTGTPVHAVGAGTVVTAGFDSAYGNNVVIRHSDGIYTLCAHMSSLSVSVGETVTTGQQIGLSGATGNVTGPHVHFEARTTADYGSDIDPVAYLRSHGVSI
ncbi:M23 family metallopeptidase [Streptomyces sp. SID13666]|uniref:M23 family metallopeptidase n=1 Tax=Streptomyces TaxID=1883 RepID=UPI0011059764|nr:MULTISPECIES: M23 family metallopeptidase [Streptomyces]MCZ4095562.1 M23 family metallopeptidase [Streptomyces sp. H39-C1]NEA55147.1 M23 family metallopeptidase [Streptomyces sp. SID13666]NEA71154.1 M23 family metallopeptidase [Streptomyces sp. SID13588]QNA75783.1 M23 family metallopeptidase [Streptomyces sp. So13.3]